VPPGLPTAAIRRDSASSEFSVVESTEPLARSIEDVITNARPNPWDSIAGVHLIEQAGGRATDIDGEDWHHDSQGLVASNGHAHDAGLAAAHEAEQLCERKGT